MKKEQKRKILFYGILAGALLLFAACAAHLRRAGQHFFSTSCRCSKRSDRNTRRNFQRLAGR